MSETESPCHQIEVEPYIQNINSLLQNNPYRSSTVAERTPLYQLSDHYRRCVIPDRPPCQSSTVPVHRNPIYLCQHIDVDHYRQLIDRVHKNRAAMRQNSAETQISGSDTNVLKKVVISVTLIFILLIVAIMIVITILIISNSKAHVDR